MHFSFAANRRSFRAGDKKEIAFAAAFGALLSVLAPPAHAVTAVGATPGSHQVSPSGAFTYTVPIAVPPGVAGMEPKLSLAYNSQGGNGLLGIGWSLAGLSVIHRCPKTVVQDGVSGGVNYDANDRYCLDGQRLIAVSGAYGGANTEYRTESESYSRIVSYGSQGTGPASWKAWTKSGQILEYGNTVDSRVEAQGKSEVMVWAMNRLSDTVGNYLSITYIEDNPNGQYYPDRIDYTGNTTANKTPTNSVAFTYEARPDINEQYIAGTKLSNTQRLTKVTSFVGTEPTYGYSLAYQNSVGSNTASRLVSVVQCEGAGDSCLAPTTFNWTLSTADTGVVASGWGGYSGTGDVYTGDLNGDGRADLIFAARSSASGGQTWVPVTVSYSTGNGFASPISVGNVVVQVPLCWEGPCPTFPLVVAVGDVNGDGRADLIAGGGNGSYFANAQGYPSGYVISDPDEGLPEIDSVTNGLTAQVGISYVQLTDAGIYTPGSGAVYPHRDMPRQTPLHVVSSVATSDGTGGSHLTNYTYAGAKSHQLGGGFLGFRQVTVHDPQAHIRSTTTYRQDYPYQGQPLSTQKLTDSGVLLSQSLITYTDQLLNPATSPTWHQSLPTHSVESSYELNGGALISSVVTDTQYDSYGNPTSIFVDSGGGFSKSTTNLYDNIVDADRWFLGRLRRSTVTSVTP